MYIKMLGTGGAFAKKYYNNNALIFVEGYTLLIDCGITAPLSLHELGIQCNHLNGILITHLHADHIGGLEEIAFKTKFIHKNKLKLFIPEPLIYPLWENSLKAGLEDPTFGHDLESFFEVVPLKEHVPTTIHPSLTLEIVETKHVPSKKSYSMILNDSVFYSSDMTFDLKLIEYMYYKRGSRYIFHECQFEPPPGIHTTLAELLTLPEEIQSTVYLMHYGDHMENYIGKTGSMKIMKQHQTYTLQLQ